MADNVTLPGTGEVVATDDVGSRQFQLVKPAFGVDGEATQVSAVAPLPVQPYGELLESIEALRMAAHSLTRSVGMMMPDTAGRMRIALDAITASLTLATITTVGTVTTVTTVGTVTNQTNIGGTAANEQVPALMRLAADALRRNISVT